LAAPGFLPVPRETEQLLTYFDLYCPQLRFVRRLLLKAHECVSRETQLSQPDVVRLFPHHHSSTAFHVKQEFLGFESSMRRNTEIVDISTISATSLI
jgi:hypothetical protein